VRLSLMVSVIGGVLLWACGGGATSTTETPDDSVDIPQAPPGTELVVTLGLDEVASLAPADVMSQLDELGLQDASFSVFAAGDADTPLDLEGGGALRASGALVFVDGESAEAALQVAVEAADAFLVDLGASSDAIDPGIEGGVALSVDHPSLPGDAAAIAWVEGDTLRLAFAQGGQPVDGVRDVTDAMTESP
jgi:hypothetical protein